MPSAPPTAKRSSALQPANPGSTATVLFEVKDGDTPADLGPRLQDAGLIRNATVFTYYVKYVKQFNLKQGVFTLSPSYTMDKIISILATAATRRWLIRLTLGY